MTILLLLLLLSEFVALVAFVYNDRIGWASSSIIVGLVAYDWFFDKTAYLDWWHFITTHPIPIVLGFIAYMAVGVLWSFFKYKRFVRKNFEAGNSRIYVTPSQNIDKIINWMIFWELSMAIYLLTVPLQDLGRWLYRQFGGVYDRILIGIYGTDETHDKYGTKK